MGSNIFGGDKMDCKWSEQSVWAHQILGGQTMFGTTNLRVNNFGVRYLGECQNGLECVRYRKARTPFGVRIIQNNVVAFAF